MMISNCCGARFYYFGYRESDICSACAEHAEPMEQDDPSIEVIEMPEMTEEWREKIRFTKGKDPMGAGFTHKGHEDNG